MVIVDSASVKLTASYKEPTVAVDGSPEIDLASTQVFYTVNGGAQVAGPVSPATAPSGGGNIAVAVTVPVANGTKAVVAGFAVATSLSGKIGAASPIGSFVVDRTLAPGAPTGFTLA